jgi:hypothetical protein
MSPVMTILAFDPHPSRFARASLYFRRARSFLWM